MPVELINVIVKPTTIRLVGSGLICDCKYIVVSGDRIFILFPRESRDFLLHSKRKETRAQKELLNFLHFSKL